MQTNSFTTITLRGIIGFIQGLSLYGFYLYVQNKPDWWQSSDRDLFLMPAFIVALLVPLLIVHGIGNMRGKTLLTWSVSASVIISSLAFYAVFRDMFPGEHPHTGTTLPALLFFTILALFIAQPLILSGDHDKRIIAPYPTYFDTAWKLAIQIVCIVAFTGVFWLLLKLGASLFDIVHLNFFEKLITKSWFAIPATALIVTTALHITDVNAQIVRGIRTLILILFSWLLPLLTGIISVFLISLLFTDFTLLWKTGYASLLLIITASLLIILINATYQDGIHPNLLRKIQRYSATLASCLLIPLVALAMYALYLRVHQYGWTVQRIEAAACMMIIAFYAIGYFLAVFISQTWLKLIEHCNVAAAILILATYLALFTPLADPARLMVLNQLMRLQSGQVAPTKFDFFALQRDGARYGGHALLDLQKWQGRDADYVHAQAKKAFESKIVENSNSMTRTTPITMEEKNYSIITHTSNGKLPITFLQQDWNAFKNDFSVYYSCFNPARKSEPCHAWVITDQEKSPLILILGSHFTGFQQDAKGIWQVIGEWGLVNATDNCRQKMREAAQNGKFKLVAPIPSPQPDIEIMGWRVPFEQKVKRDGCPLPS